MVYCRKLDHCIMQYTKGLIGLVAIRYQPLNHAKKWQPLKIYSLLVFLGKMKPERSSSVSMLFIIKQLFHACLLDIR